MRTRHELETVESPAVCPAQHHTTISRNTVMWNYYKLDSCCCVTLHRKAAVHSVVTSNVSATVSQKWVQGDLCIFHQNVARLSLFRKNLLSRLFKTKCQLRTTSNFWQNFGQFPHLPENSGMRRRMLLRDIKIMPYDQLFVTYPRAVHSLVLRSKG